jgi:hypothetical protein
LSLSAVYRRWFYVQHTQRTPRILQIQNLRTNHCASVMIGSFP